jgi:isoamylase
VTPRDLLTRMRGSPDLFGDDGRPAGSLNFIVAHDGFTLNDLFRCNEKNNGHDWPFGPSDGGSDQNYGLDWGEEDHDKLARTSIAWLMLASGTPMLRGGDEFLRTTICNNNPYNLDSPGTWLDWSAAEERSEFTSFVAEMTSFRRRHPALTDVRNFFSDARWLDTTGSDVDDGYLDNPGLHFLAMMLPTAGVDGETGDAIYVAYNGWVGTIEASLPRPPEGTQWYLALNTGDDEAPAYPPAGQPLAGPTVTVVDRAVVVAVAR